ncbi:MAG: hypothetical protein GWO07_04595 [Candidatus Dadabacteria bacterium]|nr:hypothetical protein [Candidatus Dadabacteria bacterium]NIS08040.1 hypothetical protein [Candidatus Dadabacteria bacterium]NIV40863.1 hypothetical protein [Candidatus Dadabacteria bacterium]NIY21618.1 hypothetical protein [Candidatus Dadabacteria bacterium]
MADANQLQQVFLNMLINAEQAMLDKEEDRQIIIETKHNKYMNNVQNKVERVINI